MTKQVTDLPNINFATNHVAYDPNSQSLVLANSSSIANYSLTAQKISAHRILGKTIASAPEGDKTEASIALAPISLRFVPVNKATLFYFALWTLS